MQKHAALPTINEPSLDTEKPSVLVVSRNGNDVFNRQFGKPTNLSK